MAQFGGYLGPGVMSRGSGDIGQASGQQVNLRFFADVSGVYDSGIQPFALDAQGNLLRVSGLYGVQVDLGAYGVHQWRQAQLGLNYTGNFTHYDNASAYDGSNQALTLGYTYQKSRRVSFDFRALAGTSNLGYGTPGFYATSSSQIPTNIVNQPTALLFDNRTNYAQATGDVNFILTPRTVLTAGGDGFLVRRDATGLAGTDGWDTRGSLQYRVSRTKTIGVTFLHFHFDFPPAFGQSDENLGEVFFSALLNPRWTFLLSGGLFESDVEGVRQVALSPVVAALLGQSFGSQTFNAQNLFPSGSASLTGNFKTYLVRATYARTVVPGNGLYLTSRQESATASYSYTAIKKWNLGVSGGYYKLAGIGQNIEPFSGFNGGAGFTYSLTRSLHAVGRYDFRHQEITLVGYKSTGSRVTLGLAFSPGDIPLSLW